MAPNAKKKNGWAQKFVENVKAMPKYLKKTAEDFIESPAAKEARKMRIHYGLTGHGNMNTDKDQRAIQTLIEEGKVVEANTYSKERQKRYKSNWK